MKWSFASVGLIILGLFGIVIIMLFNDITVSNEQDYYTLKYATEAAMIESVDTAYYRLTGEVKIVQEKFVENFTRRFTETSTFGQGNYGIAFYQITEYPPKVSLRIYDLTSGYNIYTYTSDVDTTRVNIVNELSAILDGDKKAEKYPAVEKEETSSVTPPIKTNTPAPTYPSFGSSSSGSSSGGGGGCSGGCCECGTCGGSQCSANTPPLSSANDWGTNASGNMFCPNGGCDW